MKVAVLYLDESQSQRVYSLLESSGFKKRSIQHSLWSFCNSESCITLYKTGKLLIQGKNIHNLIKELNLIPQNPQTGMDESGKGDVFGPLVACSATIFPENFLKVLEIVPTDSKRLSPQQVFKKSAALKEILPHQCKVLEPIELSKEREKLGSINKVLDRLYSELAKDVPENSAIILDAYSRTSPIEGAIYTHGAERFLPVAVASIIARETYLRWLLERNLKPGSSKEQLTMAKRMLSQNPEFAKLIKTFFLI
ncbi:MAG: hypothetical protein ABDH18_00435 [Aquificaceae bacterium]